MRVQDIFWKHLPLERVPLNQVIPSKLVPSIPALLKVLLVMARILKPRSGDRYPHLFYDDNMRMFFVEDGNHRISVASLFGKKTVKARVFRKEVKK